MTIRVLPDLTDAGTCSRCGVVPDERTGDCPCSRPTDVRIVLAIDPGTTASGWVLLQGDIVVDCGIDDNDEVLRRIGDAGGWVVIERIEPRYGLRMGWETIAACEWVGRFTEAARPRPVALLNRSDILRHLGIPPKASADSGVRAAMLDRWGGAAAARKGGPLARVSKHAWSALGVAVAWRESCRASFITTTPEGKR